MPHIDANLLAAARAQINHSSSSSMDHKTPPPPSINTSPTLHQTGVEAGGANMSEFLPFLPTVPGSPISPSTWSSHPVCTNPKDAITLSNIDRYLSGGSFSGDGVATLPLESSPTMSDQYHGSSCSVSSPGSDSSMLWDCVFTPIKHAMGAGGRDQKCPSPSESDSSGVSSAGSTNDALAESLSEMMVRPLHVPSPYQVAFFQMNFDCMVYANCCLDLHKMLKY